MPKKVMETTLTSVHNYTKFGTQEQNDTFNITKNKEPAKNGLGAVGDFVLVIDDTTKKGQTVYVHDNITVGGIHLLTAYEVHKQIQLYNSDWVIGHYFSRTGNYPKVKITQTNGNSNIEIENNYGKNSGIEGGTVDDSITTNVEIGVEKVRDCGTTKPSNPSKGDYYTSNNHTYIYDGTNWHEYPLWLKVHGDTVLASGNTVIDANGNINAGTSSKPVNVTVVGNETIKKDGNGTNGNLTVEGNETVDGDSTVNGDSTVKGNETVDGTIKVLKEGTNKYKYVFDGNGIKVSDENGNNGVTINNYTVNNTSFLGSDSEPVLPTSNTYKPDPSLSSTAAQALIDAANSALLTLGWLRKVLSNNGGDGVNGDNLLDGIFTDDAEAFSKWIFGKEKYTIALGDAVNNNQQLKQSITGMISNAIAEDESIGNRLKSALDIPVPVLDKPLTIGRYKNTLTYDDEGKEVWTVEKLDPLVLPKDKHWYVSGGSYTMKGIKSKLVYLQNMITPSLYDVCFVGKDDSKRYYYVEDIDGNQKWVGANVCYPGQDWSGKLPETYRATPNDIVIAASTIRYRFLGATTKPTNPSNNNVWFNKSQNKSYVYKKVDGVTDWYVWDIELSENDLYLDSGTKKFMYYDGTRWNTFSYLRFNDSKPTEPAKLSPTSDECVYDVYFSEYNNNYRLFRSNYYKCNITLNANKGTIGSTNLLPYSNSNVIGDNYWVGSEGTDNLYIWTGGDWQIQWDLMDNQTTHLFDLHIPNVYYRYTVNTDNRIAAEQMEKRNITGTPNYINSMCYIYGNGSWVTFAAEIWRTRTATFSDDGERTIVYKYYKYVSDSWVEFDIEDVRVDTLSDRPSEPQQEDVWYVKETEKYYIYNADGEFEETKFMPGIDNPTYQQLLNSGLLNYEDIRILIESGKVTLDNEASEAFLVSCNWGRTPATAFKRLNRALNYVGQHYKLNNVTSYIWLIQNRESDGKTIGKYMENCSLGGVDTTSGTLIIRPFFIRSIEYGNSPDSTAVQGTQVLAFAGDMGIRANGSLVLGSGSCAVTAKEWFGNREFFNDINDREGTHYTSLLDIPTARITDEEYDTEIELMKNGIWNNPTKLRERGFNSFLDVDAMEADTNEVSVPMGQGAGVANTYTRLKYVIYEGGKRNRRKREYWNDDILIEFNSPGGSYTLNLAGGIYRLEALKFRRVVQPREEYSASVNYPHCFTTRKDSQVTIANCEFEHYLNSHYPDNHKQNISMAVIQPSWGNIFVERGCIFRIAKTDNVYLSNQVTYIRDFLMKVSDTASDVKDKVVSGISEYSLTDGRCDFSLRNGTVVYVAFKNKNTADISTLTLNVNDTGAKPILIHEDSEFECLRNLESTLISGDHYPYKFRYNGSKWELLDRVTNDCLYNRFFWMENEGLLRFNNNNTSMQAVQCYFSGIASSFVVCSYSGIYNTGYGSGIYRVGFSIEPETTLTDDELDALPEMEQNFEKSKGKLYIHNCIEALNNQSGFTINEQTRMQGVKENGEWIRYRNKDKEYLRSTWNGMHAKKQAPIPLVEYYGIPIETAYPDKWNTNPYFNQSYKDIATESLSYVKGEYNGYIPISEKP